MMVNGIEFAYFNVNFFQERIIKIPRHSQLFKFLISLSFLLLIFSCFFLLSYKSIL